MNLFTPVSEAADQAALVKDLGTEFEQDSVDGVADLLDDLDGSPSASATVRDLLADARLHSDVRSSRRVIRPTVVRLINDNVLPAERISNRHRLLLDNVLAYLDDRGKTSVRRLSGNRDRHRQQ